MMYDNWGNRLQVSEGFFFFEEKKKREKLSISILIPLAEKQTKKNSLTQVEVYVTLNLKTWEVWNTKITNIQFLGGGGWGNGRK